MSRFTPDDRERLAAIGSQSHCLNCDAPRSEIYCSRCGQRHVERRLSLGHLLRELPGRVFQLQGGVLLTLFQLWRGPGAVARRYVLGERRRYTNPFTVFLIAATVQLAAFAIMGPTIKSIISEQFAAQQAANEARWAAETPANDSADDSADDSAELSPREQMEAAMGGDMPNVVANLYVKTVKQGYTYAAFLFFCLPFALFLRFIHGRKSPYKLGEHLVFAMYTVAQLLIATALSNLLFYRVNMMLQGAAAIAVYLGYAVVAHRGFYEPGAGSLIRSMIAFVLGAVVFFVALSGIFLTTFLVTVLIAKASVS